MNPLTQTDAWGVDRRYQDALGVWHDVSDETVDAVHRAMGAGASQMAPPVALFPWIVREGERRALPASGELWLEDGRRLRVEGALPADVPPGYHTLHPDSGAEPGRVIVAPARCWLPSPNGGSLAAPPAEGTHASPRNPNHAFRRSRPAGHRSPAAAANGPQWGSARQARSGRGAGLTSGLDFGHRHWGWAAQLYAARSRQSWGIGDLADLRRLGRWSAHELGARILLINPLAAPLPLPTQQPSPYFSSSRLFRSPLYLAIEEVPGAQVLGDRLTALAAAGRDLNRLRIIDRNAVFALKMQALEAIWQQFPGDAGFDRYCRDQGDVLHSFAVFNTIAEQQASGWPQWPQELRHPQSPAVARFAAQNAARVRFHQWLQWLIDRQLAEAGRSIALIQDLPVGFDGAGADAWMWQDQLAEDVRIGSPPDEYSLEGQNWGLPPFIPHRLRAAGYDPFIRTIRAGLRHSHGLRIDHVMGLFRLFWIPAGAPAGAGTFVRYPVEDLLSIVALESQRAAAVVVGEDLGTVEEGVRERLAEASILSYRLLWFEPTPPEQYPAAALTAITTHDLPTVAGLWTGADLEEQKQLGLPTNDDGTLGIRQRLCQIAGLRGDEPVAEVVERSHAALARTPSMWMTATLEDAAEVRNRPNVPGTTEEQRPNWSIALPVPLEDLEQSPLPRRIARVLL